jgi:predicted DsbA family dithiol-disulfide isomerase
MINNKNMKVEIWSDVMCPFCYIGKRKFENALEKFSYKNNIEIHWRSFQLNPEQDTNPSITVYEYLAERKGWTLDYSKKVHAQLAETAKQVGLDYNFDDAIPANSMKAHRLSHLASKYNVQDAAEEKIFTAYFTEGKNIDDNETLISIGTQVGLPASEIKQMLDSDQYLKEVQNDIQKAEDLGIRGVPFFVFDNKYAVSGAQSSEVFLNALETSWKEYENNSLASALSDGNGATCSTDGNC